MHTLRSRLIFSHILPILIVTPLIGIAIYAVLLTQGALATMGTALHNEAARLTEEATLYADLSGQVGSIWQDPAAAQRFLANTNLTLTTLTLLDEEGRILASSEAVNAERIGEQLAQTGVAAILSGESSLEVQLRDPERPGSVTDVIVPVFDVAQQLTGVLLLSREVSAAEQRMTNLSWLLLIVVVSLLILAILIALWLALRLERALRQVTGTVYAIANGNRPGTLPEQDIDEFDSLYRAVNTLVDRLHTLEDARRRLLANLVHELGRPLGSLLAAVDALRRGASEEPELRDELLTGMADQIGRMQPLLEDLTRLHGQVLGSLELKREPTALSQWLPEVMTLWRHAAAEKSITWRADIPLDLPEVSLDRDQIGRTLGNLFSNAVKYTPEDGVILVEAGVKENSCWIAISDNGPGIPEEEQTAIFEPFQRGQADRRFPQGMGLGLSIARDIVVAHGGRIDLASSRTSGSRFTIWLPIEPNEPSVPPTLN